MKKEITIETLKEIHIERINTLVKYLEQKIENGSKLALKRKEILEILGISEGDSAKMVFRILNELPELYADKITYVNENREHIFTIADNNVFAVSTQTTIINLGKALKCGNKYITTLSAERLNSLWSDQVITYNPLIQRGKKIVVKNGVEVEEDICSEKNIKEIAKSIAANNYVTDTITINVSGCEVQFIGGELTVVKTNKNSEINILDGQHRTKGVRMLAEMVSLGEINLDLSSIEFPIQVEVLTVPKAQSAFAQFVKGMKISSTRKDFFDNENIYTISLKEMLEGTTLPVETVKDNVKATNNLVTFGTLSNALKEVVKEKEINNSFKTYMKNFFNELVKVLSNKNEENSMVKENISFYGYMSMAKEMYEKNIPVSSLETYINKIDMDKNSNVWLNKVLLQGKKGLTITNKKDTRKYIANLFKEVV